jgi:hypothetical protein
MCSVFSAGMVAIGRFFVVIAHDSSYLNMIVEMEIYVIVVSLTAM